MGGVVLSGGGGPRALTAGRDGKLRPYDFDRPRRSHTFARVLEATHDALAENPHDASAIRTMAEWYAFRGVPDWASELYEEARAAGGPVTSLELARCYWQANRPADAERELRRAL